MTAKSPTASLKRREVIGEEQFTQRRDVFDKHDTVFMPSSPTVLSPSMDAEVEISVNGDAGNHFKRSNAYSSMRETRREDIRQESGYRNRKYSDNFTSENNQNEEVDYRRSLADRTRRLYKLRRDFLASTLHDDPVSPDPFSRSGTRASLPVRNGSFKKESPTLFKFPFAEPYSTPPPTRRIILDLGPIENGITERDSEEKENECPEKQLPRQSLPNGNVSKVDHHKIFEDLIKRYSPQRKPVDWSLPPTKPKVIGAIHKSTSDSVDDSDGRTLDNENEQPAKPMNELFIDESKIDSAHNVTKSSEETSAESESSNKKIEEPNSETVSESEEKKDKLVELELIKRQLSRDAAKRPNVEPKHPDSTIPDLLEKINHTDDERKPKSDKKKVKRKRSFLDKLLGRKKEKQ